MKRIRRDILMVEYVKATRYNVNKNKCIKINLPNIVEEGYYNIILMKI